MSTQSSAHTWTSLFGHLLTYGCHTGHLLRPLAAYIFMIFLHCLKAVSFRCLAQPFPLECSRMSSCVVQDNSTHFQQLQTHLFLFGFSKAAVSAA